MGRMTKSESIAYLRKLALKEKIAEESLPTRSDSAEEVFRELEEIEKNNTEHLTTLEQ